MFEIKFETDNAAFDGDCNEQMETARILMDIAHKVKHLGEVHGSVVDIFGNTIGKWGFAD